MPVQDLTPQLRTRLSKVERAVGFFVILATLLLLGGLAFYIHSLSEKKGWTKTKFKFFTYLNTGEGVRAGQAVTLMGFSVGQVVYVEAMPAWGSPGNVFVQFEVLEPYDGYIYDDSIVKVVPNGFLGDRRLEIVKGGTSGRTNLHEAYKVTRDKHNKVTEIIGVWDEQSGKYFPVSERPKGTFLIADEGQPVTERAEQLVAKIEGILPDVTNKVTIILSNLANVTAKADTLLAQAQPILKNADTITSNLKDPDGSLGQWVLGSKLNSDLTQTLASVNLTLSNANQTILQAKVTVANTDTNVTKLASSLDQTLINLADLTSNLNAQVAMNTNLVSNIDHTIVTADTLMQGLKKHWLLRSAFKEKKTAEPKKKK